MTLTQTQRVPLARTIANLRTDWQLAGIDAALVKLAQQINDEFTVARIAIAWASRADARTPEGMNQPELRDNDPTSRTPDLANGWTTRPGPECPEHHNPNWRTDVGMWSCCWTEQLEERSAGKATEEG